MILLYVLYPAELNDSALTKYPAPAACRQAVLSTAAGRCFMLFVMITCGCALTSTSKPVIDSNILIDRFHLAGARAIAYERTRHLAFVAASGSATPFTVIDVLSMPGTLHVVGAINGTQGDLIRDARGIAYDEVHQLAYVSSAVSIAAVDVADPMRPIIVGTLFADKHILDAPAEIVFDAASRHLFVVGEGSASMVAVNVSNSKLLTVTSSIRKDLAMRGARGVVYDAASRRLFVASRVSHSLTSIDVSVISSPNILAVLKDSTKLHRAESVAYSESGYVLVASYGSAHKPNHAGHVTGTLCLVDARDRSALKISALLQTKNTYSACAVVYDPITRYALLPLEAQAAVAVVAVSCGGNGSLTEVAVLDGGNSMAYPRGMFLDTHGRRALVVAKGSGSLAVVSLPRQLSAAQFKN